MIAVSVGTFLDEFIVDKQSLAIQMEEFRVLGVVEYLDIHFAAGRQAKYPSIPGKRMEFGSQSEEIMDEQFRQDLVYLLTLQGGQFFICSYDTLGNGLYVFFLRRFVKGIFPLYSENNHRLDISKEIPS